MQRGLERFEDVGVRLADRREAADEGVVAFEVIAGAANFRQDVEIEFFKMRRDIPGNYFFGAFAENIRCDEQAGERQFPVLISIAPGVFEQAVIPQDTRGGAGVAEAAGHKAFVF